MSAKAATVRLYVAVVLFVVALIEAGIAALKLVTAALVWLGVRMQLPTPAKAEPALRLVAAPSTSPGAERLTRTLTNLGFKHADVKRFVTSVGPRVESAPIGDLIKEGLAALGKAA